MQIQDDIQALRRGELDLDGILGRIRSYLRRTGSDPAELREALDDARRADQITAADYDLLTQCIADESEVRSQADEHPEDLEDDLSMTRLATTSDLVADDDRSHVDIGSRLRDRFILDEVIGVGGMGTVYRGRDVLKIEAKDRNPYVAIKILNDSFKQRPDAFIVLQREASRQQRLAHPNIATVYDFDRTGGVMFITMEYLDGVPLDEFVKDQVRPRGGLPLAEAMPIIEGMCAALSHAHARGIVHADFKPGNCFIAQNKQLKVLDFGIARAMKDPARGGEQTLFDPRSIGALTPAYASPEMLDNSEDADPRDDIYALACVTYELLSGRHPFHRIPGDQAKANGLKPDRIKHLSRRQNEALARGLAFERADRTASVQEFLEGLSQPSTGLAGVKAALAVGAGGLVVAGALIVPGLMDRWSGDAVIEDISAGRIEAALEQLDDLSRPESSRVLQESRGEIVAFFQQRFDALMSLADAEVDFPALDRLLAEARGLYPDSAALQDLANRFSQRREAYLSEMAQKFEQYLGPEYLLPQAQGEDLHDLVARLEVVDPTNPLLEDSRIPGAYADSVESALEQQDVARARRFLQAGLALAPEDDTLGDLRDRVVAAEQRVERQAEIARLTTSLQSTANDARSLPDLQAVLPVVGQLTRLDPDNATVPEVGETLASRFAGALESVSQAPTLPEVEAYLDQVAPVWTALGQAQMVTPVEARRTTLIERQEALVAATRRALQTEEMRAADGRTAADLIAAVRAINPDDPRAAILQGELVQARRVRAEQHVDARAWDDARAELQALSAVPLTTDQRDTVATELQRIDAAEQAAIRQAQVAAQLEEQERQAEQQRLEQQRQRELAAERETRIAGAAAALQQSLSQFDSNQPQASTQRVLARINELEVLQPDHPALASAMDQLGSALDQAVRRAPDAAAGLAMLAEAEGLLGSRVDFSSLRSSLEAQRSAEQEAQRRAAVSAAETRLQQALEPASALADAGNRETARRALAELGGLLEGDAGRLQAARQRFVDAHLTVAEQLVNEKRFSVAERVLESASEQADPDRATDLTAAREFLDAARDVYRRERARQETLARIDALAQRFNLEVSSGQLTRARQTLAEYRQLAPDSELAQGAGTRTLADGYLRVARQRFEAGNLDGAQQLVSTGLELLPGHAALQEFEQALQRASLATAIADWFAGDGDQSAAAVRALTQRYRELAPEEYRRKETVWAQSAAQRLSTMVGEPETYNRFLQDAKSILNNDGALAELATIMPPKPEPQPARPPVPEPAPAPRRDVAAKPAVPALSADDLMGRWCADNVEIEFERNRMVFTLNGARANYDVDAYEVAGDKINVNWDGRRLGQMIFEFGRFTEGKDKMVQLRGRPAKDDNWQTYNRDFLRCG